MVTTVLECQDYAIILLDTEGIDAVGASETMAMSMLTLTTLLSSFLIYNSKKVPQKVDLNKMRCFSQLSASLLFQCGESVGKKVKRELFPHFLWLLRDVSLKMTDREGKEVAPTKYLHTRVLASESGELTDLGKSLVSVFPSMECTTLPIPSTKRDIIRGIVEQQDKLKPAFNAAVDALIQQILQKVAPKRAVDGTATVNGKALAALAGGYVEAVNKPGALPDLDQGWQAVVRLELNEFSYKLVRKYEKEMEEALKGNLPVEEGNLLKIHQKTLDQKKDCLKEEIYRINPLHSKEEDTQVFLDHLEETIMKMSGSEEDGERKVVGGTLYRFVTQNLALSKQHCQNVFMELVKNCGIQEKVNMAVRNSEPFDITTEIRKILAEYKRRAIGPASSEVWERGLAELNKLSDILKMIPKQPQNISVKTGSDKIKISWDPPEQNPKAVEEYVVHKRTEGREWEEAGRTKKTSFMVRGLKSNTKYEFQVIALNTTMMSVADSVPSAITLSTPLTLAECVGGGALGSLFLPMVIGNAQEAFKSKQDFFDTSTSDTKWWSLLGLSIAALPVSIVLAPVTLPVLATASAAYAKQVNPEPEESDDESSDH